MFTFFVARIWLAVVLLGVASATIPSYIKVCSRKDPDINNCIRNSINLLRDKLSTGIEELNVPSIEPLYLPKLYLNKGSVSRNNKFEVNITDLQVFRVSEFQIRQLKSDPERLKFDFEVLCPRLDFKGKYKIDATFLVLKLVGEGNFNGSFNDYKIRITLRGQKAVQNNLIYANFTKLQVNIISIGKTYIFLDNLFNGNAILGAASNDILKENTDLFMEEIKPALESQLEKVFLDIAKKIASSFTYDELFPEN